MLKSCLTVAVLICSLFSITADAQNKQSKSSLKIAREGIGVEGITVGKSTKRDVEKKFGKSYKLIKNGKYSFQMTYKNGLSFYLCQTDKQEEIFDLEMRAPFKVKTSKGIILRESTVEDVERIYGKAKEGLRYRGVEFYYNKIRGKNIVTVIDIVEPEGLRQCKENI
ncbi:hypothetical protein BH20ACI4_BH20ACI4_12830 [soil metagenome]